MKVPYLFLLISIAMSSFNCAGSKKSATNTNNAKSVTAENKSNMTSNNEKKVFRFTVSFISKGAGTDYQIKQKYDAFITDFETRNKVKLTINKAPWGREGETDYCFELNELNNEIVEKFITESKALLSTSDRINIGENTNCRGTIK
jgi:hypothetical protein